MASNSKRRRRVLGASCILAALIIAGSSFAWFTSRDEVTNRLSANADYDVSIVESFAPPENWLPGQEVNKDVYAVNTGNIGAFVKEEVSGSMTYTVETKTDTLSADSVKLTKAERYVVEVGSYLAGAFDANGDAIQGVELGREVVAMTPSATDLDGYTAGKSDFAPQAEGVYVFRRSVDVDPTVQTKKFSYEAYYYMGGEFYKVELTSVTPAGEDGNVSAATYSFFKEETKTVVPTLTYDATKNYLVASVPAGSAPATFDELKAAADAYDQALEDYQLALAAYQAATNENAAQNSEVAALKAAMDAANVQLQQAIAALQAARDVTADAQAKVDDLLAQRVALEDQIPGLMQEVADKSDAKQAAGDAVQRAEASVVAQFKQDVQTALNKPVEDATYAELNGLFNTDYANYEYYQLVVAQKKATEEYNAANAALTAAQTKRDQVEAALATAHYDLMAAIDAEMTAQDTKDQKQNAFNAAKSAWEGAVTATGETSANVTAAKTKLVEATQTLAAAEKKYNELSESFSRPADIKINIKLSDAVTTAGGVADQWQLLPTDPSATNVATFYYTGILGGGETSSKLIDSVELDASVTDDMYKSFDFDLNVALKSAQISTESDGVTINTDAAVQELNATPTLTNNKDVNTAITWAAP